MMGWIIVGVCERSACALKRSRRHGQDESCKEPTRPLSAKQSVGARRCDDVIAGVGSCGSA